MKLAMADLGKMGLNMVRRRVRDGHEVVVACDLDSAARQAWRASSTLTASSPPESRNHD